MKWTKDKCYVEALKYKYRYDFSINNNSAYRAALKYNWMSEICSHMKPKMKWTKDKCHEKSLLCKTKKEFRQKYTVAYSTCLKNKWLDDICKHLKGELKPMRYWTKNRCENESLKYKHRNEFQKNSRTAYITAYQNNWLDDICKHMIPKGNLYHRLIYLCVFSDNCIYIGLTYDFNKRIKGHLKKGTIYNHIQISNEIPNFKKLTKYLNINEAVKMEEYYHNYYKNKGYTMLNKAKTGSLGFYKNKEIKSKWNYNRSYEI
jgi:predicted GIY-YIG superfamily endonuclease